MDGVERIDAIQRVAMKRFSAEGPNDQRRRITRGLLETCPGFADWAVERIVEVVLSGHFPEQEVAKALGRYEAQLRKSALGELPMPIADPPSYLSVIFRREFQRYNLRWGKSERRRVRA